MNQTEILRSLPKIDGLLQRPLLQKSGLPAGLMTELARTLVDGLRREILAGERDRIPDPDDLCRAILDRANLRQQPGLRRVINATGITLHTNLGRACLSERAAQAAAEAGARYSTLEYDLEAGARGSRCSHVERLLCRLTGAEAAVVVNNNAASVLLILTALGKGGEVIVSRGELVEIGGSFRIPEIMEQCGCTLREVGATNKTHLQDYAQAIGDETRALLKVHTSNYRIVGFSSSVSLQELAALGRERNLPVIEDLGSGCLVDLQPFGISDEPLVRDSIRGGVDVLCFSGDKLLGGPQAGIIIGKKQWVEPLKTHPLIRALRVDKMTLAALEQTLRAYENPARAMEEIPTLYMLSRKPEELQKLAESLCNELKTRNIDVEVWEDFDEVGGGSVPCERLKTYAAAILPKEKSVDQLERQLRRQEVPVIGRIARGRLLLDVRTLFPEDLPAVLDAVERAMA